MATPLELSIARRPVMLHMEVELRSEAGVLIYDASGKEVLHNNCTVILTNLRLVWVVEASGFTIPLAVVDLVKDLSTLFRGSKRFRLHFMKSNAIELKFMEGT